MNRTEAPQTYRVTVGGIEGLVLQAREVTVAPAGIESIVASVQLSPQQAQPLRGQSSPIEFEVAMQADGSDRPAVLRERSTFHVPR